MNRPRRKAAPGLQPPPPLPRRTRAPKGKGKSGMITFRCSAELASNLRSWAAARGLSVTDYIVLWLRTVIEFEGLPPEMAAVLRRERDDLGMTEFEYHHYCSFLRALEVRKKGPGFDLAEGDRRRLELKRR